MKEKKSQLEEFLEALERQLRILLIVATTEKCEEQIQIILEVVEYRIRKSYAIGIQKGRGQ